MKKMKVLFFGAGVLGSLYAAKLHEAGTNVTLVARGSRYEELKNMVLYWKNVKRESKPLPRCALLTVCQRTNTLMCAWY